jgi:radical S-adenosyl methionine domain-containing protein 2
MNNISSVCWDITSKCNDACEFCFRDVESKELSLNDNLLILNKLIEYGITKITFTGGEASLYPDLWKLIQYAHNHNMYTNLITNALCINEEFYINIEKYLSSITLSLDGSDSSVQKTMTRNDVHFNNVISFLGNIINMNIERKINTLVSKINIDNILNILPILYKFKINRWKIIQFAPLRYSAKLNEICFSVSDSDFAKLEEKIKNEHICENIEIKFQSVNSPKDTYYVSSNGNVRNECNNKPSIIGNILTDDISKLFTKTE